MSDFYSVKLADDMTAEYLRGSSGVYFWRARKKFGVYLIETGDFYLDEYFKGMDGTEELAENCRELCGLLGSVGVIKETYRG